MKMLIVNKTSASTYAIVMPMAAPSTTWYLRPKYKARKHYWIISKNKIETIFYSFFENQSGRQLAL